MICKVCQIDKPKTEMRKSIRGRTLHFCLNCKGFYRCIHCNKIVEANHCRSQSGTSHDMLLFSDSERIKMSICYSCDYKHNKERYRRYVKKRQTSPTLKYFIQSNIQNWKRKTLSQGVSFDLSPDYLTKLWEQQDGRCHYTNKKISLIRGRSKWDSVSLDRVDPSLGYCQGNVVWTTRLVNTSKNSMTREEFTKLCQDVIDTRLLHTNEEDSKHSHE